MKPYWDSSALIETAFDAQLQVRLDAEGGTTRLHTLGEVFSALTGKVHLKVAANDAAKTVRLLAERLDFVDLSKEEILDGLDKAHARGVRGGRVHDYLHALAAAKSGSTILTTDKNDFAGLIPGLSIEQV